MMDLSRFPRISLAHLPTPLEPLPRLSEALGGPSVYIKRDDCTGLALGGNKTRKLEFLMADALGQGADIVITGGAVQSNHVRQTLAAAARLGLDCKVLLEERVADAGAAYRRSGNVLLDGILGADIEYRDAGTDMEAAAAAAADALTAAGRRPYVIPGGGSNRVGALGYVDCARELTGQLEELGLSASRVVVATGSAGTQAGLVAGFAALDPDIQTVGVCVGADERTQTVKVQQLASQTARYIGMEDGVSESRVVVSDRFVGEGYGIPTEGMLEAVRLCARLEGLLLDPVYTGKAMAGLIAMARSGDLGADETVVFVHTGGSAALFAYEPFFNGQAAAASSSNG